MLIFEVNECAIFLRTPNFIDKMFRTSCLLSLFLFKAAFFNYFNICSGVVGLKKSPFSNKQLEMSDSLNYRCSII